MKDQEWILSFLRKTKNMLMMNSSGTLYILKAYTFEEDQLVKKKTFFKEKEVKVSYISSLTFDKWGKVEFDHTGESQGLVRRRIYNELQPDRARYTNMCKYLSQYGYTIRRK